MSLPAASGAANSNSLIFGIDLAPDEYNIVTQTDNDTVVIRPRMNTTGLIELKVGVLLPFSQTSDNYTAEIVWGGASAIRMAMNDINARGVIPGAYITLIEKDSYPEASASQNAVTDAVYASVTLLQQGVIGVIGDVSSSWTSLSALMTSTLEIPQCSFTANAIAFSDKTQYKYFFRTIPTQVIAADIMLAFAASQGWSKVGVLYTDDPLGQQFCQHAIIQAGSMNMQVTRYQAFSLDDPSKDISSVLHNVTTGGVRVFLVAATGDSQTMLMMQAAELGYMTDDYVWLLMGDYSQDLLQAVDARNANLTSNAAKQQSTDALPTAINSSTPINFNETFNGLFMFDNWLNLYGYDPFETFLDEWSKLNPAAYPYAGQRRISTNEGLAYSCMMVMAEGFSRAVANTTNITLGLTQLQSGELGQYMTPPAFNVGYVGPEGPMILDANGDVTTANYLIYNLQRGIDKVVAQSMSGQIQFTSSLMFHDGTSNPPADAPPSMALNPDFSSPVARVILVVSGIGVFFTLAVFGLVVTYRKHEIFKASSPLFCCLELVGFILTYASVITMIDIPSQATCYVTPVLFNLGFLLILGNMIAKNYRIYRIFNNIFITRTVITDLQLIKTTSLVVGLDMIILIIGLVVSRPVPTKVDVSFSRHYWECHSRDNSQLVLTVLTAVYAAGMLLFATFLAYKTRGAGSRYSHYSETKQMGLSVYNILFSALVGFAVLVNPLADFYTRYYITVIAILWATTFSLLILFLPKVHAFFRQRRREKNSFANNNNNNLQSIFRNVSDAVVRASSRIQHQPSSSELISLDQMLRSSHIEGISSNNLKENKVVEVHEGEMPVRRVFRYFPFLSHWEMQHIMVFPWLGYFSHFSDRTKGGAVMSYSQATVHTAKLDEYVLKVHGQGMHDMYIQLPDLNALKTWEHCFNQRRSKHGPNNNNNNDEDDDSTTPSFLNLGEPDEHQQQPPPQQQTHHNNLLGSSCNNIMMESTRQLLPSRRPSHASSYTVTDKQAL